MIEVNKHNVAALHAMFVHPVLPTRASCAHTQANDFSHFHELHSKPLIPWTTRPLPAWLLRRFPLNIRHNLELFYGDAEEWVGGDSEAGPSGKVSTFRSSKEPRSVFCAICHVWICGYVSPRPS